MEDDDKTARILTYSPIGEARKVTGEKDSPATDLLSLFNVQVSAHETREAMLARKDTYSGCSPEYFLEVVEAEGFVLLDEGVKKIDDYDPSGAKPAPWWMFWHPEDGIFMKADLWNTIDFQTKEPVQRLNSCSLTFNLLWMDEAGPLFKGCFGSSSPVSINGTVYGCMYDGDGRKGLRFRLKHHRRAGAFVKPWVYAGSSRMFLSPAEWNDLRDEYDQMWSSRSDEKAKQAQKEAEEFCRKRFDRFPADARECMEIAWAEDCRTRNSPPPDWNPYD